MEYYPHQPKVPNKEVLLSTPPPPQQQQHQQQQQLMSFTPPRFLSTPPNISSGHGSQQTPPQVIFVSSSRYHQFDVTTMDQGQSQPVPRRVSSLANSTINLTSRGSTMQQSEQVVIIKQSNSMETPVGVGRGGGKKATTPRSRAGRKTPHNNNTPVVQTNVVATPAAAGTDDEIQIVVDKGVNSGRRGGARSQRLDSILSNGTEMSAEEQRMHKTRENERKRRMAQKSSADKLRELVPGLNDGKARKAGEGIVMQKSAEYIEQLQEQLRVYREKEQQQLQRQRQLQQQISVLQESGKANMSQQELSQRQRQQLQQQNVFQVPTMQNMSQQQLLQRQLQQQQSTFQVPTIQNISQQELLQRQRQQQQQNTFQESAKQSTSQQEILERQRRQNLFLQSLFQESKHQQGQDQPQPPFRPEVLEKISEKTKEHSFEIFKVLVRNSVRLIKAYFVLNNCERQIHIGVMPRIDANLVNNLQPSFDPLHKDLKDILRYWILLKHPKAGSAAGATPGQGTTTPGKGTSTPGTGTSTPGTGTSTPGTGTTTPGTGTSTPGAGTSTPGMGTSTPGAGTSTPTTGTFSSGAGTFSSGAGTFSSGGGISTFTTAGRVGVDLGIVKREIEDGQDYHHVSIADVKQEVDEEGYQFQEHHVSIAEVKKEVDEEGYQFQEHHVSIAEVKQEVEEDEDHFQGQHVSIADVKQEMDEEEEDQFQGQHVTIADVKQEMDDEDDEDDEDEEAEEDQQSNAAMITEVKREMENLSVEEVVVEVEAEEDSRQVDGESQQVQKERNDESTTRRSQLYGWSINGIGQRVPTDDEEDESDDDDMFGGGANSIQVENGPNGVVRMSENLLEQVHEEPAPASPPPASTENVTVLKLELANHDRIFREIPLFKHDFIWHSLLHDEKTLAEVERVCKETFKEVKEDRRLEDLRVQAEKERQLKQEMENKRRKKDNDDEWNSGGKKRGRGRGRGRRR